MHDDRTTTEDRLTRFVRDHLEPATYRARVPMRVQVWRAPGEPVPAGQALAQQFEPFAVGSPWGAPWSTTWFRLDGAVPDGWHDDERVRIEAVVDLGFHPAHPGFQAEGLAYDLAGEPIKGVSPLNHAVPVTATGGESVEFLVEAAGNPDIANGFDFRPTALGDKATAGTALQYRLAAADLALLDLEVWGLRQDIWVLDGLMRQLPADRPRRSVILRALERMLDALDPDDVAGSAPAARAELRDVLAAPATASAHQLYAVGHAHIDSAWLWPVRETVRKCARTFSNVLALMDTDPTFVFACSSAQQLAWIRDGYPGLFERIRDKVRTGQFVPVGGMWVESDTNMVGGEAMARQFVEGKQFFLEEFGLECEEAWLPDSFGYSAALPGIFAAAGIRWFLTQKISWNNTNRMPHHTFWWEGIDGTRIFTHFPPVDKYNSDLSAEDLAHAERTYAEHGKASTSLVPYGWGDGGGGPTREMLAAAHRTASLEGSPRVRLAGPREFFAAAEAEYPDAPSWTGELYLESHRGTYTSQARTKQGNRRSEHLLREAELWAATAAVRTGAPYPYQELQAAWRTVLLQQFHDILPGSSIAWVHREAERNYAEVAAALEVSVEGSLAALAGDGEVRLLANAAPHERAGVAALALAESASGDGADVVVHQDDAGWRIANGLLQLAVDRHGHVTSLRDLWADGGAGRELVPAGEVGNRLQLHRDLPNQWDAWDVDEHYRRTVVDLDEVEEVAVVGDAERGGVRIVRTVGKTRIEQEVTLSRGAGSLEVATTVDWHERQKLLKLAFPLAVHAREFASEVQFGHLYRPTRANTSWDAAKFETCAQRWVHVGEPGYGVAVVNDATYGHDVTGVGRDTTVRLSLLRAPLYPDPDADQGEHTFRVSLVPGATVADAVRAGYQLNLPARVVRGAAAVEPLVTVADPDVVVEAVKLAGDRSGDVVVRLYESTGRRAATVVRAGFACDSVHRTDLLERMTGETAVGDGGVATLELHPFEIVTLRFVRS